MSNDEKIIEVKKLRVEIDALIQKVGSSKSNAEETLAFRALQQAKHWLGESLSILGAQNPYPNSKDPSNAIVDPTADVAKEPESAAVEEPVVATDPTE